MPAGCSAVPLLACRGLRLVVRAVLLSSQLYAANLGEESGSAPSPEHPSGSAFRNHKAQRCCSHPA